MIGAHNPLRLPGNRSIRKIALLPIFCIVSISASFAGEHVLLSQLSAEISTKEYVRLSAAALSGRGWTITKIEDGTVSAELEHSGYDCEVSVDVATAGILLTDDCGRGIAHSPYAGPISRAIPERWVGYIRRDLIASIGSAQRTAKDAPNCGDAIFLRRELENLQGLHKDGLIEQQELDELRKRAISAYGSC